MLYNNATIKSKFLLVLNILSILLHLNSMKWIKIVLIAIVYLAIFKMPYYYYDIMKVFCFVGFLIIAKLDYDKQNNSFAVFWVIIGLMLNPFIKLQIEKDVWLWIDAVIIGLLLLSFLRKNTIEYNTDNQSIFGAITFFAALLHIIYNILKENFNLA